MGLRAGHFRLQRNPAQTWHQAPPGGCNLWVTPGVAAPAAPSGSLDREVTFVPARLRRRNVLSL